MTRTAAPVRFTISNQHQVSRLAAIAAGGKFVRETTSIGRGAWYVPRGKTTSAVVRRTLAEEKRRLAEGEQPKDVYFPTATQLRTHTHALFIPTWAREAREVALGRDANAVPRLAPWRIGRAGRSKERRTTWFMDTAAVQPVKNALARDYAAYFRARPSESTNPRWAQLRNTDASPWLDILRRENRLCVLDEAGHLDAAEFEALLTEQVRRRDAANEGRTAHQQLAADREHLRVSEQLLTFPALSEDMKAGVNGRIRDLMAQIAAKQEAVRAWRGIAALYL